MKWVTNTPKVSSDTSKEQLEYLRGKTTGDPQATEKYSVAELKAMGMVGVYVPEEEFTAKEIRKELYNRSQEERRRYGHGRSLVTHWEHNVHPQWLYKLACKKAGKASLKDDEIIPTVFGEGSMELFRESAMSEYWFWQIVSSLSLVEEVSVGEVQRAIYEIQANHTRMIHGVAARLENLTPVEAVRLTAYGAILWDEDTDIYIANPLWP